MQIPKVFDYRRMWPTSSGVYDGIDASQIALTFDDGPNDRFTLKLLELLQEHGIKATFFVVGRYVRKRRDVVRAVHKAGHVIGNHSESHSLDGWNGSYSVEQLRADIGRCQEAIGEVIGIKPTFFRPPYGKNPNNAESLAAALGLSCVIWSVTAQDWERDITSDLIVRQVQAEIDSHKPQGEIILFHDGNGETGLGANRQPTVEAVERLIDHYAAAGKRFVSLSDFAVSRAT